MDHLNEIFKSIAQSDDKIIAKAKDFYINNREKARTMFGYPANNTSLSEKTLQLILYHYASPFSNNCGDIDEDENSNYSMTTKHIEKQIVKLFADKFAMGEGFWGYVATGGSESNYCGIELAFLKNPNAVLYYAQSAHYSVAKYAAHHENICIPTLCDDSIDTDILISKIKENFEKRGLAANIVLTHGTTESGACDDVDKIVKFLKDSNIPYYIHLDAALFGGIPNNQKNAPVLLNLKERGVNSVSVSLHKYIGFPDTKSVFVATEKPVGKNIEYIGQQDTTTTGSRSIPAYALYNHISEQLSVSDENEYQRNIIFFERLLKDKKIKFSRNDKSNIFIIDEPSREICKKYQLACFTRTENGKKCAKAHIIIFPSHTPAAMEELVKEL